MTYVIATSNPLYASLAKDLEEELSEPCVLISEKDKLETAYLEATAPEYIFFPHWSYIIPEEVYKNFTCIMFHMTDLPYGRGGSPLQNLIVNGHTETVISAFKCNEVVDGGDIYLKKPLSLQGSAQDIFTHAKHIIIGMIAEIIRTKPEPYPQEGKITTFKRRTPEQSNIQDVKNINDVYDYIRMLDAEGYPHAYLDTEDLIIEFREATLRDGTIEARAVIRKKNE